MSKNFLPDQRPSNEAELEGVLRRAYDFAKKGDYASAIGLCDWVINEPSTRIAGLRKRAAVYEHQGEIEKSIEDLEAVISSDVDEPADMYSLGLLYLQVERDIEAEAILEKGINVSVTEGFDYYLNSCRLLRAEALLRIGKAVVAATELNQLPPGFSVYVYGRGARTKEDMLLEANK